MGLFTKTYSIAELKEMFVQSLFNKTNKVTKVSDDSVLNGIAFGVAKIGQKALKDISLIENHVLIDTAYGTYLDILAETYGVASRFGALGSSVYVLIVGAAGTVYDHTTITLKNSQGTIFNLEASFTMPIQGYTYVKVNSVGVGKRMNIDPLTLAVMTNAPTGHTYVINEFAAEGGIDEETDEQFKKRIKEGANLAATDTISRLTQICLLINSNILRLFYQGINSFGQTVIAIVSQNGSDLTPSELAELTAKVDQFVSLTDLRYFGSQQIGILFKNIEWETINIDFRCDLFNNYNPDLVRIQIQQKIAKYLDYRYWQYTDKVEWDDLLGIVKNTKGVRYVPDNYFIPNIDLTIPKTKLPRVQSFIMRNLNGDILIDSSGYLNPTYFPNKNQINYQRTIINIL